MTNEFCAALNAAIDTKTRADAALLRLRKDMCAGITPYSQSAILSAMENCDDAMEGVWESFKNSVKSPTHRGIEMPRKAA